MSTRDRLELERAQMRRTVTTTEIGGRVSRYFMNQAVAAAGVLIAFTAGMVHCGAGTWAGGFMPLQVLDTTGQAYYQNAFTLIDLPSEDMVEALPELRGLVPAANQQQLPRLLSEVGKNVEESFQKFTEIVANEQVTREQCGSTGRLKTTLRQEFSYLILTRHEAGQERIEEYRTGMDRKLVQGSEASALFTKGFAAMWVLFYPGNQPGSKFRYLGQQRFGEHLANVIGFAQKPGSSAIRGFANVDSVGLHGVVLYQGVVWIDMATNRILKMRADLLKPRLDAKLEMQTTEIQLGEVHISDAASTPLWVPLQVTVTTVWNGQVFHDEHLYSNYRLPGSNSKIQSAPEETAPPSKPN